MIVNAVLALVVVESVQMKGRSMKPFNFNKWFNIWLVIIFGLTLMSLAATLMLGPLMSGMKNAVVGNLDSQTRAVGAAAGAFSMYDIFSSPAFILGIVAVHLIVCVGFVAVAYFVLKSLSQRSGWNEHSRAEKP
jgi:hypothetical protein